MGYVGIGDVHMMGTNQLRDLAKNVFAWQHNWGDVRQAMKTLPTAQRQPFYALLTSVAKQKWGLTSPKVGALITKIKSEFPPTIAGTSKPKPKPPAQTPKPLLHSQLTSLTAGVPRAPLYSGSGASSSIPIQDPSIYDGGGSGGSWGWGGGGANEDIMDTSTSMSQASALPGGNRFTLSKPTAVGGKSSLLPWIIGGVAVVGVIYFATRK